MRMRRLSFTRRMNSFVELRRKAKKHVATALRRSAKPTKRNGNTVDVAVFSPREHATCHDSHAKIRRPRGAFGSEAVSKHSRHQNSPPWRLHLFPPKKTGRNRDEDNTFNRKPLGTARRHRHDQVVLRDRHEIASWYFQGCTCRQNNTSKCHINTRPSLSHERGRSPIAQRSSRHSSLPKGPGKRLWLELISRGLSPPSLPII